MEQGRRMRPLIKSLFLSAIAIAAVFIASCSKEPPPPTQPSEPIASVKSTAAAKPQEDDLFHAVTDGSVARVKALLDAKADVNAKSPGGYTALMLAAEEGNPEVARALLDAKADVNAAGYCLPDLGSRQTALMLDAWKGHAEAVNMLLAAKANVNARSASGMTALIAAFEHADIVRALLNAGADRNAKDDSGDTAFTVAARNGYADSVRLLLDGTTSKKAKDQALLDAARSGFGPYIDIMKLLLNAGADKETRDNRELFTAGDELKINHGTPLIWAAAAGEVEAVKLLLEAGANRQARDYWGHTALWEAEHNHYPEVVRLLQSTGNTK